MSRTRINRGFFNFQQCLNAPNLSMNGSGKATGSSSAKTIGSSSAKTTGGKKRVMSAAGRAKVSKANKERWAKFRAAKAKGK
jgi:hypothetical protein